MAIGFLQDKNRVKVDLMFRGRQIEHMDLGASLSTSSSSIPMWTPSSKKNPPWKEES
jgi:translation initiation factor IF-3